MQNGTRATLNQYSKVSLIFIIGMFFYQMFFCFTCGCMCISDKHVTTVNNKQMAVRGQVNNSLVLHVVRLQLKVMTYHG